MARPKSEDKRNAILAAAAEVFAERGLSAATSSISAAAGVAEGTLFTYFRTKDDLINALYRDIKLELADVMMSGFPRKKSVRHRLQHVWEQFVNWGVAAPARQRVLTQIEVAGCLTDESVAAGLAPFAEIQTMAETAKQQRIVQDLPDPFIAAIMNTLAETTMKFIRMHPAQAEMYRIAGFEVLWAGITCKR